MAVFREPSIADELHDIVECSICSEAYDDPRILPCIHTFCLKCIEKTGSSRKPGEKVSCPLCREEFTIPQEGFRGLQKNFFMLRIMEIKNIASPPIREKLCDLCSEDNEHLTVKYTVPFAESFCIECHQNLCQECGGHHRKNKVSKAHKVVAFGTQIDADALAASSLCAQHPAKPLEMLCTECQKVICMMCFAESHHLHKCADVNRLVPEFKSMMKADVEKISAMRADSAKETEMIDKANIYLLAAISIAESEIIQRSEQLKQLVDQHTELLLNELTHLKAVKTKEIEIEKVDVDQHLTLLDSYRVYCLNVAEKGSPADICQASKELHDKAASLETAHSNRIIRGLNPLHIFQISSVLQNWLDENYNIVGTLQDLPLFEKSAPKCMCDLPRKDTFSRPKMTSLDYPDSRGSIESSYGLGRRPGCRIITGGNSGRREHDEAAGQPKLTRSLIFLAAATKTAAASAEQRAIFGGGGCGRGRGTIRLNEQGSSTNG